jgi:hypothetical protein
MRFIDRAGFLFLAPEVVRAKNSEPNCPIEI